MIIPPTRRLKSSNNCSVWFIYNADEEELISNPYTGELAFFESKIAAEIFASMLDTDEFPSAAIAHTQIQLPIAHQNVK